MKPARPGDIPQVVHEGTQEIMGVTLRTYVLDDGRRIINADDFHKLMEVMMGDPAQRDMAEGGR